MDSKISDMADEQLPDTGDNLDFDWDELQKTEEPCPNCGAMMPADTVVCDYCERPSSGVGRRRSKIARYVMLAIAVYVAINGVRFLAHLFLE